MRHLIDTYIQASDSRKISAFEDHTLIELIVKRGANALEELPESVRNSQEAMAETIENNVRSLIIDEQASNPRYYEKMSDLLDGLIRARRDEALAYEDYLKQIIALAAEIGSNSSTAYPAAIKTPGQKALYDNLDGDEPQALAIHEALKQRPHGWRGHVIKQRQVKGLVRSALANEADLDRIMALIEQQDEY